MQWLTTTLQLPGGKFTRVSYDGIRSQLVTEYNRTRFVSTLFPLVAGTFGPMASAFNICSLAVKWRIVILNVDAHQTSTQGPTDPTWNLVVNAISLAIAILANLVLLAQMTDRISSRIGLPCTIAGWFISSFMLLGLVAAAPSHMPLSNGAAYSQAYYYACFACAVYFILATLLTVTALSFAFGRYAHAFKLTMSQRSLMLQTIIFLSYLLAAAAVYCRIENWDFLDSVYFVNVTLFTIGFGDVTPHTHLGRSLFFPMAAGGILFVGLIIASIRTLVLESGSRKISTRIIEKARHNALRSGNPEAREIKLRGVQVRQIDAPTELDRRRQEFEIMREVQRHAAHDNRVIALAVSISSFFVVWFVGAIVFWQAEMSDGGGNWSYFESLYFTFVAVTTIGYGDFYPTTNSGKPAFVLWSLIALPTLTVLIGSLGDAVSESVAATTLWLATHLPEGWGVFRHAKGTMTKKRNRDGAFEDARPPGFMGDDVAHKSDTDDESILQALQAIGGQQQDTAAQTRDPNELHRTASAYRLYIILKAIQDVTQHVNAQPPRKYTFEEWAWFLKLIYEDEAHPHGHRHPWEHCDEIAAPLREKDGQKWSWMGQESPLMTMEDEPSWVLKRLMHIAQKEARRKGDECLACACGLREEGEKTG